MIILIDARTLGEKPSGIGIYLYHFVIELNKRPDITLALLTDVDRSEEFMRIREEGIPICIYGKPVKNSIGVYSYFRFVQKQIRFRRPDIFWEVNNLLPVRIRNRHGKIAVTIHDLFPISDPDCFPNYYVPYYKYGIKKTVRQTDLILYDTETAKKSVECYEERAAKRPNLVSYIIIDHMPKLTVSDQGYFLYIGNLERRKGTDLLLKAYMQYRSLGGTLSLHLGGSVREEEIGKLIDECVSRCKQIVRLGYLSDEYKWMEYAGCSAFVFPSRAEGFGMPAVEALFYRKPLILSRLDVFEEIVGSEIPFVTLHEDEELTIKELADQMLLMEQSLSDRRQGNGGEAKCFLPDDEYCEKVTERYAGTRLTGRLAAFFHGK